MEELLQRYIRGKVSDEERGQVARWLDDDPANMRELLALRKLYDISLWSKEPMGGIVHEKSRRRIRHIAIEVLKIASILLIGFLCSRFLELREHDEIQMQTIHVPAGQRVELFLADGTQVWLNSRSTLRFPERFSANNRNVELDGEGFFSVRHDQNHPFTVQTEKYAIHVLGTDFNVKAYQGSALFEAALLKGSVEISSPEMSRSLRIRPDEKVTSVNGILKTSHISDYNYFKWKEGLFCFDDEPIKDLIEKLQLYYDIKIEVHHPFLRQYHYSGKFRIQDGIEHVLKVLQLKHKFTYTKNDDKNLIIIQ